MTVEHPPVKDSPLLPLIETFLADLAHEKRSPHTRRAYAADLTRFASFHAGPVEEITADALRAFFDARAPCKPATQARAQAALASFLAWAHRRALIAATPMAHVARVRHAPPAPRGVDRATVRAILAAIPAAQRRDHLLFRLLAATGLRVGAALALSVEDLDLTPDRAHLRVVGPDQRRDTLRLDDPDLVQELSSYLTHLGATHGPLFRALKNGGAGPLRYQSLQVRWQRYCARAGVSCTLHQLRHAHAPAAVPARVSPALPDPHLERTPLLPARRRVAPTAAPPGRPPLPPIDLAGGLRQSRPFQVLPDAAVAALATTARCQVCRRGELSLDPAQVLDRFYVVLRGRLGFYRLAPDGHKLTIATVRDGDIIVFASREWAGGAKSCVEVLSEGTILCHLALREVRQLMLAHPPFALALFDEVVGVSARVADRLGEWAHPAVAVRLAHTLAALARANTDQMVTETHDELAWLTGASRATVTKEIRRLRAAGLIASHPHHHGIHVPDPERLAVL